MATFSIVHRMDKINKKGLAPVHFRIIQNRKVSYIASGIMLSPNEWDSKNNKVTAKNKNSKRLTAFIASKFMELQSGLLDQETLHKNLTSQSLKEKILGPKPINIFDFADNFIQNYRNKGAISTYDKSRSIMLKLEQYRGGRNLCLQDIDANFLSEYESYLRSVKGNNTNTIHTNLKFFRVLFNEAYRRDLINHSDIPFNKYILKLEKTQRNFLTQEELNSIAGLKLNKFPKQALHRDMFIFAAYSGGIRISDMLLLKWKNFEGTHVRITIKKTGTQISIKLPQKALDILNIYKHAKMDPDQFIFPVLPFGLDLSDPITVDKAISRGTAIVNKSLNVLAKKAHITKHISFHIARHTWATQALIKGISIDKVSKLMGHANIRETQIYAKIVNEELDKAMEAFND